MRLLSRTERGARADWAHDGIGVIGSGSWGTALAVHLAHTGHDVRLWARDAALAVGDVGVAREPIVPAGDRAAVGAGADVRPAHCPRRRAVCRDRRAVARRARCGAPRQCAPAPRLRDRQRDERPGRGIAAENVGGVAAGVPERRRCGRAVRSEFRKRTGAQAADGDSRGRRLAGGRRSGDGALSFAGASALRQQRRHRRRAWRLAEEHHRHRRRRRRRARPRPQRAGGADHARPRRTVQARGRAWRAAGHAGGPRGPRRSGADVHRRLEPQPPRRPGAGEGPVAARIFSPAPGWLPKACARPRRRSR